MATTARLRGGSGEAPASTEDEPAGDRRQLLSDLAKQWHKYRNHHHGFAHNHRQEIGYWDPAQTGFTKSLNTNQEGSGSR